MKQHYRFLGIFILLMTLSTVSSCQHASKKHGKFKGFAPLLIGAKLDSLAEFKMFKLRDKNVYDAERIDLSCGIGIVDRVTVNVQDKRITAVAFTATELSDKDALADFVKELKSDTPFNNLNIDTDHMKITMFTSKDGKIALSRTQNKTTPKETDYYYFDIDKNARR